MPEPFDPSFFIGQLVEETRDRLKSLNEALLVLERAPDATPPRREILRQAHTLKGMAKMLGLTDIAKITHAVEGLVTAREEAALPLDRVACDALFKAFDLLASRVERLADGDRQPLDVEPVVQRLQTLAAGQPAAATAAPAAAPQPPGSREAAPDFRPAAPPPPPAARRGSLRLPVTKLETLSQLTAEFVIQNLQVTEHAAEMRQLEFRARSVRDRLRGLRDRTAHLADASGSEAAACAEAFDTLSRELRQLVEKIADDQVRLNLITSDLRDSVLGLTMLPLATLFAAVPRAVRDLSRQFGRDVDLVIRGADTELDRTIVEQIGDPLIHLVRNAVDHGLEDPAARARAGKPPRGTLVLSAVQQGNRILITVEDDGSGIDVEAIRAAAVVRGVAPAADLAEWSDEQLIDLVFRPGFTTRQEVTDVSGRGVGMDVVKATVERLQGSVRVRTRPGRGTSVVLDLPLSLALVRAVVVESGGELYAVPAAAVDDIVQPQPAEILVHDDGSAVEVAGAPVPLLLLDRLLRLPPTDARPHSPSVLIARTFDHQFALMVDAVVREQELVFQRLPALVREQKPFAGVSIVGDGRIVLILDMQAIVELMPRAPDARTYAAHPAPAPEDHPGIVLIVEDSVATGELERHILTTAGYRAELAHDGMRALEVLQRQKCDLVIADVDMPGMSGLELTARLRADRRFCGIPIMILTSHDAPEDRRRGIEAGADAYITKREFDQTRFLATVGRLVGR